MPSRQRRRRASAKSPNGFDLLDSLIERGAQRLVNAAAQKMGAAADAFVPDLLDNVAPARDTREGPHRCVQQVAPGKVCEERTRKVCFSCVKPFCHDHVEFYNDENWAICSKCMRLMVSSVQRLIRAASSRAAARQVGPSTPSPPPAPGPLPWTVLGVPPTADARAIKRAYHKLALDLHPDRNPGDSQAATRFQEATEAYNAMKNALEAAE